MSNRRNAYPALSDARIAVIANGDSAGPLNDEDKAMAVEIQARRGVEAEAAKRKADGEALVRKLCPGLDDLKPAPVEQCDEPTCWYRKHAGPHSPATEPARLDTDRTAKPLTEIREVFDAGDGQMRTLFEGAGKEYVVFDYEPGPPSLVDAIHNMKPGPPTEEDEEWMNAPMGTPREQQEDEDRLCALWKVVNAAQLFLDDFMCDEPDVIKSAVVLKGALAALRAVGTDLKSTVER